MKIYTRVVIDMASGETVEEESFEYEGPVALCSGGGGEPDKEYNARLATIAEKYLGMSTEQWNFYKYGTFSSPNTGGSGGSGGSGGGTTYDFIGKKPEEVLGSWTSDTKGGYTGATGSRGGTGSWYSWKEYYNPYTGEWMKEDDALDWVKGINQQAIADDPTSANSGTWTAPSGASLSSTGGGTAGDGWTGTNQPIGSPGGNPAGWNGYGPQLGAGGAPLTYEDYARVNPSYANMELAQIAANMALIPEQTGLSLEQMAAQRALLPKQTAARESYLDLALNGLDRDMYANQWAGDVANQFTDAREGLNRSMMRMGAAPGSARSVAAQRSLEADKALGMAGAMQQGRQYADEVNFKRLGLASGGLG